MARLDLKIDSNVFVPAFLPFIQNDTPEQIFYGSAGTGKSKFVFQRTVLDLADKNRYDRNFLIIRNTLRSNRDSTFNEVQQEMNRFGLTRFFDVSRSELVLTCKLTGRMAFFRGCDDIEKLKSVVPLRGVITDLIVEEATELQESDYENIRIRLRGATAPGLVKRETLMLNPTFHTHWIRKRWAKIFPASPKTLTRLVSGVGNVKAFAHHTVHRMNPFLTEQDHERYEGLQKKSKYHHDVYALGIWGVLGGTILTNWRTDDLTELQKAYEDRMKNGVDFGWTDPAAAVRCAYDREYKKVYVFDVPVYGSEISNERLGKQIAPLIGNQVVYCDSAEPKSIRELQTIEGTQINAVGAKKGRDSVWHSIQWLQNVEIIIDRHRCQPLVNELQQWQWKKDKDGKNINEPVDGVGDHAISALRYALESSMSGASDVQFFG